MDSNNLNNMQQPNPYFNNGNPNNGYPGNGNPNSGYPNNENSYNYGNNIQPQKAPNIFQQFALSFVPNQYSRLARVKTGSMIGFVVLLVLAATIIEFVKFSVGFATIVNTLETNSSSIPEFSIKNGKLSLSSEILLDQDGMFIYLTDEIDEFTYEEAEFLQDNGYTRILLMSRSNMVLVQDNRYQEMQYSELLGNTNTTIDKDWLVDTVVPMVWVGVSVGYVFYFIGRAFWYFLCAAVYLLIALVIASVMNKKVSAGALYRTAVYSKVFMFVILTLVGLIPLANILIPGILRIAVRIVATCVFMGFAIKKLPDNC